MAPEEDWTNLPEHILVSCFQYLTLQDRYSASQVCRSWNDGFQSQYLWAKFTFKFYLECDEKFLKVLNLYAENIKDVTVELDQSKSFNRTNACSVITGLAKLKTSRLSKFCIFFRGENPVFYNGQEFINALKDLFMAHDDIEGEPYALKYIDLSGLSVMIDDKLIDLITENHSKIERLNLINKSLICHVSQSCIQKLVGNCQKLRELHVYNHSLSEDILKLFTEEGRAPLEKLEIKCRREEKFSKQIPNSVWLALKKAHPSLKVSLIFEQTCPLEKMLEIMAPDAPVHEILMHTFVFIHPDVTHSVSQYHWCLEKLVLETPLSRGSHQLNEALIRLAEGCKQLQEIHVYSVLRQITIDTFFSHHPELKESGKYTLKSSASIPHPWFPGPDPPEGDVQEVGEEHNETAEKDQTHNEDE